MSWLRLDDRFPNHEKIAALSDVAFRAHVEGLAFCAEQLTDGIIPRRKAEKIANGCMAELTAKPAHGQPLWSAKGDGYEIHDYLVYNPTREKAVADRAEASKRGKAGADARWHSGKHGAMHGGGHGGDDACTMPRSRTRTTRIPLPDPPTSALSASGVEPSVLAYFEGKIRRAAKPEEVGSLRTLCRDYDPGIVTYSIGQAHAQGEQPNNFGLITAIAKGESA